MEKAMGKHQRHVAYLLYSYIDNRCACFLMELRKLMKENCGFIDKKVMSKALQLMKTENEMITIV